MMTEDSYFFLTPCNKTEMKTDAGIQEQRNTPYRSKPQYYWHSKLQIEQCEMIV
ncbi:hypothetical protein DPMN_148724 [Dreissena polymorpha]|uniref:Uncharacterized protein n=1 Tax=Dreissena polymorpha TaxID=45954 RepID=A0A9D4FEM5_DREPO|nr:hypothetical protein DPMN_148724 [Dreissena polymorpha]